MKRKFVELSGFKRWTFRGGSDIKHTMTIWYFLDFWLITKENDNSRCIDFKQLLKMQALAVLYG